MSDFLASMPPVVVCLLVCVAKIIEISIQSLKTCMMVKGQRLKAAGLGFVECTIWGLVISTLIGTLGDNLLLLVFYCAGYATGLFLGSTLESKIALGTSNLELIASDEILNILLMGKPFRILRIKLINAHSNPHPFSSSSSSSANSASFTIPVPATNRVGESSTK
mgnify:CR=1 FL=1